MLRGFHFTYSRHKLFKFGAAAHIMDSAIFFRSSWGIAAMSWALWNKLPDGLLKMQFKRFDRLDYDLKALIVELATTQKFKCALCDCERGLIVEHDHDPAIGRGDVPTIYNTRGLTCHRCNWHLGLYENSKFSRYGGYSGFEEAFCYVSECDWDAYTYRYDCRVLTLHENELEQKCPNYWQRRLFLDKFDEWREWGARYPWRWCFGEIKDQKYGKIRSPEQFLRHLKASGEFLKRQLEENPNWEPPEELVPALIRLREFLGTLLSDPIVAARLAELKKATAGALS